MTISLDAEKVNKMQCLSKIGSLIKLRTEEEGMCHQP